MVGPTKGLSEKSHSMSSSSIHIHYNHALVRGLSARPSPGTRIPNVQLNGGSTLNVKRCTTGDRGMDHGVEARTHLYSVRLTEVTRVSEIWRWRA